MLSERMECFFHVFTFLTTLGIFALYLRVGSLLDPRFALLEEGMTSLLLQFVVQRNVMVDFSVTRSLSEKEVRFYTTLSRFKTPHYV